MAKEMRERMGIGPFFKGFKDTFAFSGLWREH